MSSPIHSRVLSRLSLFVSSVVLMCAFLTVRADLNVEWIDENTIRVTGYGNGGEGTVVTNYLGSCTNCLAISSEEMHAIKTRIINKIDTDVLGILGSVSNYANYCQSKLGYLNTDIGSFRRFTTAPDGSPSQSDFEAFTNYVYSVDNTQTSLDKQHRLQSGSSARRAIISYNNGIYDYANNILSDLNEMYERVNYICDDVPVVADHVLTVRSIVDSITEEDCNCSSGSGGSCDSAGCPCQEQMESILDYLDHIDDDQHKRYVQLTGISNHVSNVDTALDSYAKLVSRVLYNDSAIVLGDDETWTNVYFSGESENYSYDKSNILQRIELILFGMAHSTTNFSIDASSVTNQLDDTAANNVTNQFNEFSSDSTNSFLNAKEKIEAKVNSIKSISAMFVFWGSAGSYSPFTLGYVPNLDGTGGGQYIEVGNGFLGSEVSRFRQLCRYGFQLIWATSFLFLIWLFYVRLFKYVVIFLKYAFEWINEAFAS